MKTFIFSILPMLLVVSLLISISASWLLWRKNQVMCAELKMRTEAQKLLSLTNKRIRKQAYTDDLSGMGNRRAFYRQGEAEIKLARLDKKPIAALLIDIDSFKSINDQFGHALGDRAIQELAKVILSIVRANDVQGRVGGEEFAILAPNTSLQGAEDLAERIRKAVEAIELIASAKSIALTVSIGVSAFSLEYDCLDSLLVRADEGLYKAKRLGRNQVVTKL
jgi:diguanylate cyclase (GGDEF)-like protein